MHSTEGGAGQPVFMKLAVTAYGRPFSIATGPVALWVRRCLWSHWRQAHSLGARILPGPHWDGSLLKATWRSLLGRCSGRGITKIKRSIRRESPCQSINFLPLCFCTSSLFFYVTAFPTGERVVEIPEVQRLYWRTRLFGFPNQVYSRESTWRNSQKAAMIN